jgi:hypothetical protein
LRPPLLRFCQARYDSCPRFDLAALALIRPHCDAFNQTLVDRIHLHLCVTASLLCTRELDWAYSPRGTFLKARIQLRISFLRNSNLCWRQRVFDDRPSTLMSGFCLLRNKRREFEAICKQEQSSHSTAEKSRTKLKSSPVLPQSLLRRDLPSQRTLPVTPSIAVRCIEVPLSDFVVIRLCFRVGFRS